MATSEVEGVLDEWATAWSAHHTEKILALYTDDCVHEDVTLASQPKVFHSQNQVRLSPSALLGTVVLLIPRKCAS